MMNQSSPTSDPFEEQVISSMWPIEIQRYRTIKESLSEWHNLFYNKNVLDFGAGYGLSISALLFNGAKYVIGIEPDEERVKAGVSLLKQAGLGNYFKMIHVSDTMSLPFEDKHFGFVFVNAVLEHIPIPRKKFLFELWRLVSDDGYLMINETPNIYFPKEVHTTNLWFNQWLPESLAYRRAIYNKRFAQDQKSWKSSGWRGLGYLEVARAISGYQLVPERSRLRHRIFSAIGIPASIIDPYPTWVFRKIRSKKI